MPQSFARIAVHLTFSTKHRQPLITDAIAGELNAYLIGILRHLDCPPIRTNTATDHAHSLFFLARTHPLDFVIEQLKGSS
ncbi:MAG: Transposase IS200 like protein [bacterium ADurb.Bin429]|nr:MAG: Transposase IS200 like protein [bacterium ADurb.Bin429]